MICYILALVTRLIGPAKVPKIKVDVYRFLPNKSVSVHGCCPWDFSFAVGTLRDSSMYGAYRDVVQTEFSSDVNRGARLIPALLKHDRLVLRRGGLPWSA